MDLYVVWCIWCVLAIVAGLVYLDGRQSQPYLPESTRKVVLGVLLVLLTLGAGGLLLLRKSRAPLQDSPVVQGGTSQEADARKDRAASLSDDMNDLRKEAKTTDEEVAEVLDGKPDHPVPDDLADRLRKRGALGS